MMFTRAPRRADAAASSDKLPDDASGAGAETGTATGGVEVAAGSGAFTTFVGGTGADGFSAGAVVSVVVASVPASVCGRLGSVMGGKVIVGNTETVEEAICGSGVITAGISENPFARMTIETPMRTVVRTPRNEARRDIFKG